MTITVGITGSTGSLGREIIKSRLGFKYSFFKGDIRNKNRISKWISSKNLDALIHLAAIVPINAYASVKACATGLIDLSKLPPCHIIALGKPLGLIEEGL